MLVSKTIKCGIISPTKTKLKLLKQEYENLQKFLRGENVKLYSANKQQALRYYRKIKPNKEYPLSIRKDLIKVEKKDTKLVKYWVRIPVFGRRGGIWLPIKPHCDFPENFEICESKILKKKDKFFVFITIKKEVEIKQTYSSILAIDIGEKVIATAVLSVNQKPLFYGKEIRRIRRHFAWLRKRLQKRKLLKVIKRIGSKEKRRVNDLLHKISKPIVSLAYQHNALIVLGDLKGIRSSTKGKRFNRIVSNMPYYKLTKYIEYKANWLGIKVIKIKENGTSKTCPKCGSKGKRPYQGLFVCPKCKYQANADFVGALNILKRFEEYISSNGAAVSQPLTGHEDTEVACNYKTSVSENLEAPLF
jgi:putative transposase